MEPTVQSSFTDAEASELLAVLDEAQRALSTASEVAPELAEQVWRITNQLPRDPLAFRASDPYLTNALLVGTVAVQNALHAAKTEPRKARTDLRLALEQSRQALRDLLDQNLVSAIEPPGALAHWLEATTGANAADLADLLGVKPETMHRWSNVEGSRPSSEHAARLEIVARVTNQLRHVFTGPGVIVWFHTPSPDLEDRTPASLLEDTGRYPDIVASATRFRSMTAA